MIAGPVEPTMPALTRLNEATTLLMPGLGEVIGTLTL